MTFDVAQFNPISVKHGWQQWLEAFAVCRRCGLATTFLISQQKADFDVRNLPTLREAINRYMKVESYVSLKDEAGAKPPEHVPPEIKAVFEEGATCLGANCPNAAATMFRLCLDLATRPKLPEGEAKGLNSKVRRDLGLRLPWLFENGLLPAELENLSHCVREDGNDGAHVGSLTKADAEDLLDFTTRLLERLYTEPERIRLAAERRDERRKQPNP